MNAKFQVMKLSSNGAKTVPLSRANTGRGLGTVPFQTRADGKALRFESRPLLIAARRFILRA